jgi:hypothetical protein
VANGAQLPCASQLPKAQWKVQGVRFCFDLKIIHLDHFDMVLGYDWLQQFSPMEVHRGAKWLSIPYGTTL